MSLRGNWSRRGSCGVEAGRRPETPSPSGGGRGTAYSSVRSGQTDTERNNKSQVLSISYVSSR